MIKIVVYQANVTFRNQSQQHTDLGVKTPGNGSTSNAGG